MNNQTPSGYLLNFKLAIEISQFEFLVCVCVLGRPLRRCSFLLCYRVSCPMAYSFVWLYRKVQFLLMLFQALGRHLHEISLSRNRFLMENSFGGRRIRQFVAIKNPDFIGELK